MDQFLDQIKVLILDPESDEKYLFIAKAKILDPETFVMD